jgi:hypothetical protein
VNCQPTNGFLLFMLGSHRLRIGANLWAHEFFFDDQKFTDFAFQLKNTFGI